MAYVITKSEFVDTTHSRIEAVLDSASDLTGLGDNYAPGSFAYTASGEIYIMPPSGSWTQFSA